MAGNASGVESELGNTTAVSVSSPEHSTIRIGGVDVPLLSSGPLGARDLPSLLAGFVPFTEWVRAVEADGGLEIRSIEIQSADFFGPRLGFLKFRAEAVSRRYGVRLPGVVLLRGGAVGVLTVLHCAGKLYTLLTEQARVAVGSSAFLEIPAGMLDGSGNLRGVAVKEMEEETGICISPEELIPLGQFASSPGLCDEVLDLYCFERETTEEELAQLSGRLCGVGQHERISVRLFPLDELPARARDCKSVAAWGLYMSRVSRGRCGRLQTTPE